MGLEAEQARQAWEHAAKRATGQKITTALVREAVVALNLRPPTADANAVARRMRTERRTQLTQAMADLLALVVARKPYDEVLKTAAILDQHVRYFFPRRKK